MRVLQKVNPRITGTSYSYIFREDQADVWLELLKVCVPSKNQIE